MKLRICSASGMNNFCDDRLGLEDNCTRQELNSNPQKPFITTTYVEPHTASAAKSGAVENLPVESSQNANVLAAFVAVLSPEQRAELAKLLGG